MNKILSLFDGDFVSAYFKEKLLPHYPQIETVKEINIKPYKKMVWSETYHVVIGFDIKADTSDGEEIVVPVVCSAHSNESRETAYKSLRYLWDNGFANDDFVIPRPLFFDPYFNANFYRALEGENLLRFIKDGQIDVALDLSEKSARLFSRLHDFIQLPSFEYDKNNALIRTVIPGVERSVAEVEQRYGRELANKIANIYDTFVKKEEEWRSQIKLSIIHGDAHTENIIRAGEHKVGLIDFTDFSLADRFRDVGTFLQQAEHKINGKINDRNISRECKAIFLSTYLSESKLSLDEGTQARINLYYNWTTLRTVVFWLLKHEPMPEKALASLQALEKNLALPSFRAQD